MGIRVMGQCFSPRGAALVCSESCEQKPGVSSYSLAVKYFWLGAESTCVEVGELNPSMRL